MSQSTSTISLTKALEICENWRDKLPDGSRMNKAQLFGLLAPQIASAVDDATTFMRSACIEKVKELKAQHDRDYDYWKSISSDPDSFGVLKFAAWAGEDERVITALETVTIQKQKS